MQKILSFLSLFLVLLLWISAYSAYLSPASFSAYLSVVSLCFPFFVVGVLGMLLVCLLFKPRVLWIPLVGIIGSFGTLRDYCPVNVPSPAPKGCLKILSYNVMCFGSWVRDENNELMVPQYICAQKPDVACLQECSFRDTLDQHAVVDIMRRNGYNFEWEKIEGNTLACASRFPIVKTEVLCCDNSHGAVVFYVALSSVDTLLVVNAHLESMNLTIQEREKFKDLVQKPEGADTIKGKREILKKIVDSALARALQADTIADFLRSHAEKNLILCGDFNDTPVSYAHRKVCAQLTDAFRASGNGIGRSFNKDAIYVRIDNIFCSSHWKPYACKIDNSVSYSDHYSISTYLKRLK